MKSINLLFQDNEYIKKIQRKLPELFQIAEIESSRAGKIGMEVGTIRERILVALLLYVYGEENIETNIPTTASEVDVKLYGQPISIKTFTNKKLINVKLIWTVDAEVAKRFQENYIPNCNILLVHINWGGAGNLYYFTVNSQRNVLQKIGREKYIKLPKSGTNPRGVEISAEALIHLSLEKNTLKIPLTWEKRDIELNTFNKWIDLWAND